MDLLILDDAPMVRKILAKLFGHFGWRVHCAAENAEALALIRDEAASIELIIQDLNRPGGSGVEFLSALRELPAGLCVGGLRRRAVPVLIFSGHPGMYQAALRRHGDVPCLQKPLAPPQLFAAVVAQLDRVVGVMESALESQPEGWVCTPELLGQTDTIRQQMMRIGEMSTILRRRMNADRI